MAHMKAEDIITFGKYKGKRIKDIYKSDPQYLLWCDGNVKGFRLSPQYISRITNKVTEQWRRNRASSYYCKDDIIIGINGF